MSRSYKSVIKLVTMKLRHELKVPSSTYIMSCEKSTHLFLFRDAAMDRMKLLVLNQLKEQQATL